MGRNIQLEEVSVFGKMDIVTEKASTEKRIVTLNQEAQQCKELIQKAQQRIAEITIEMSKCQGILEILQKLNGIEDQEKVLSEEEDRKSVV